MNELINEIKTKVANTYPKNLWMYLKTLNVDLIVSLTDFLPVTVTIGQRIYHIIHDLYTIPLCEFCNCSLKWYDKRQYSLSGYIKTCGSDNCKYLYNNKYCSPYINVKNKYNVENISQTDMWHDKVKNTNIKLYGVEWNTQTETFISARKQRWIDDKDNIIKKRIDTNIKTYGTEHGLSSDIVKNKITETFYKKYNKSRYTQTDEFLIQTKETNNKKYGKDYHTQTDISKNHLSNIFKNKWEDPEYIEKMNKSSYRVKKYTFPSGKNVFIQGNEPHVLDNLQKICKKDGKSLA